MKRLISGFYFGNALLAKKIAIVVGLVLLGSFFPNAVSASTILNATTCASDMHGTWDNASSTCTIPVYDTINGEVTIPVGVTLHIGASASVDNWGTLIINGTLINDGSLYSDYNNPNYINNGVLINNNDFQLMSESGSTLTNNGTLINRDYLRFGSDCTLNNAPSGVIDNYDALSSSGTINNSGVINAYCGATY